MLLKELLTNDRFSSTSIKLHANWHIFNPDTHHGGWFWTAANFTHWGRVTILVLWDMRWVWFLFLHSMNTGSLWYFTHRCYMFLAFLARSRFKFALLWRVVSLPTVLTFRLPFRISFFLRNWMWRHSLHTRNPGASTRSQASRFG